MSPTTTTGSWRRPSRARRARIPAERVAQRKLAFLPGLRWLGAGTARGSICGRFVAHLKCILSSRVFCIRLEPARWLPLLGRPVTSKQLPELEPTKQDCSSSLFYAAAAAAASSSSSSSQTAPLPEALASSVAVHCYLVGFNSTTRVQNGFKFIECTRLLFWR